MGSSVSKIGCKREGGYAGGGGSGRHHKRKTNTVDKTSIGIPTGFRQHQKSSGIPPTEQLKTQLAEITQRLQEVNVHIPPQPQPQPQPRSAGAADPCDVSAKSRSDLEQLCMDKPNYNMSLMKCYVERKIDAQVQKHAHARRRSKSCSQA
ncbi:hypothetical protein O0I10_004847 [Lichtheimia ornata]|uniref:Uncharacterized protein n=1 Tax=Lichtheimia ornata TaxID=688661 RepID=A0AAD7Y1Z1_9FUNG|nr:uncharacterized protein O0I10_004847 [Lichtheimia ornata]KAJ8659482.1 hypothetical protein O0I10_004847 [Lichtheimia ornata]